MALNTSSWIECPEHFVSPASYACRTPTYNIYDSLTLMTDAFYPLSAYLTFFLCLLLFANKYHLPKKNQSLISLPCYKDLSLPIYI